jgi:hypothetical protein
MRIVPTHAKRHGVRVLPNGTCSHIMCSRRIVRSQRCGLRSLRGLVCSFGVQAECQIVELNNGTVMVNARNELHTVQYVGSFAAV